MPAQWERWLRYAKAKLDDTVTRGDAELDRREAEQRARAEGKPWLDAQGDAPTLDEARARIEHQAAEARRAEELRRARAQAAPTPEVAPAPDEPAPDQPSPDAPATPPVPAAPPEPAVELAAQQRAAEERLATMRRELGLDGDPAP